MTINAKALADATGIPEDEVAVLLSEALICAACTSLLEMTNGGLHDSLNVTEWDAVRLLANVKETQTDDHEYDYEWEMSKNAEDLGGPQ